VIGGFVALGGGGVFTYLINRNFKKQEFYQKSLELLKNYPPGVNLFGQPMRTGNLELGKHERNYVVDLEARIAIPIHGSKKKGFLHTWSTRPAIGESWEVNKLDMEIDKRQWTFYINPNASGKYRPTQEGPEESSEPETIDTQEPVQNTTDPHLSYLTSHDIEKLKKL